MTRSKIYPYVSVIISMLLWGMSFVWTAILLEQYQPITIIFLRLLISTLFLFLWLKLFKKFQKIEKSDYKLFLISALFNPFFYFLGENYGIKLTSPTVSAVMIATIPLFTPIAAYMIFKELLTRLNIIGMIVSFSGVLIIILKNDLSFEVTSTGILALLFAVISAIIYTIYLKRLSTKYNPIFIVGVQNLIGFVYFLPVFLIFEADTFEMEIPPVRMVISLLALSIFCSSLAFIGFTIAIREIGVSKANIFANLIPVFTGIFSFFVIGESLDNQKILGIIIVVSGLYLSQIKWKSSKQSAKI